MISVITRHDLLHLRRDLRDQLATCPALVLMSPLSYAIHLTFQDGEDHLLNVVRVSKQDLPLWRLLSLKFREPAVPRDHGLSIKMVNSIMRREMVRFNGAPRPPYVWSVSSRRWYDNQLLSATMVLNPYGVRLVDALLDVVGRTQPTLKETSCAATS